jgi:hypothetical protein
MGIKKENELSQDLARVSAPGHFRMILKSILKNKVTSNKRQAPEATSNKQKELDIWSQII